MTVEVIGKSALGRDMYGVVINRPAHADAAARLRNWLRRPQGDAQEPAPRDAAAARRIGDDVKVPIFVQGGIHGNEYEGVDAAIDTIEKYATTPRGQTRRSTTCCATRS